jgi:hypothetical protein
VNDRVPSTSPTRIAILRGYLIVTGLILLAAAPCACLPHSWMDAIHRSLGLGTLSEGPMTLYLARSASVLYASIGPVYLFLACDPIAYAGLLRLLGTIKIALGVALIAIDVSAGLPWFWTAWEGPFVIAWGVGLLLLVGRRGRSDQ